MQAKTLQAEVRTESGKGPARQLRLKGLIPAIFYGPGQEPTKLTIDPKDVLEIITGQYRRNQLIDLALEGESYHAIVQDLEVHPVSRKLLHVDLYKVAMDRPVDVRVPFSVVGRALGVVKGGKLTKVFRDLPVRCLPNQVPAEIVYDVTELDSQGVAQVKDLDLAEGVEVLYAPQRTLAFVETKEVQAEQETESEES